MTSEFPLKITNKSAFSLVELSIVLVIIGFITGGILGSMELVRTARLRAQISQIDSYQTALGMFQYKYDAIPGDIKATKAADFGFTSRTGAADHGDGDGKVTNVCCFYIGIESVLFWKDLAESGLIAGGFGSTTEAVITAADGEAIALYLPKGKMKGNFVEALYTMGATYGTLYANVFLLVGDSAVAAGSRTASNRITPQDAFYIDSKMDDGRPQAGFVRANIGSGWTPLPGANAPAAPASGVCVSNATGTPYNTASTTGGKYESCYLSFEFAS